MCEPVQPNFFLLGANKCGTTTLYELLEKQPQVLMSRPKEPSFFAIGDQSQLEQYCKNCYAHHQGEQIVGEASSHYLTYPWVAANIHRVFPEAKLAVILRCPVKRAFSHWRMQNALGIEPRTFPDAIGESLLEFQKEPLTKDGFKAYLEHRYPKQWTPYIEAGHHARNIQRFIEVFGPGRILVLSLTDLASRPELVLKRLCEFLGVQFHPVGESVTAGNKARGPLGDKLNRWALMMRLDKILPKRRIRQIRDLLLAAGDRPKPTDPKTMALLQDHYRSHTKELKELLGRDIMEPSVDGGLVV